MQVSFFHTAILWIVSCCSCSSFAQHQSFDSILKNGTLQIYEHPDEAIRKIRRSLRARNDFRNARGNSQEYKLEIYNWTDVVGQSKTMRTDMNS